MAINLDYKGKVVVVTGVSSGIGRGTILEFARAGATVAGCSRTERDNPSICQLMSELEAFGADPLYVQTDVTSADELKRFIDAVVEKYGRIDVLVSNAGRNYFLGAKDCDENGWNDNMKLNLKAHWLVAQLCRPYLEKADDAAIILMGSNHAYYSIPGCFPYNVTKAAIVGMVRSLALEWSPKIRTVGVAPGFVETCGNDAWFNSFPNPEAERQRTADFHPVKRLGTPQDVGSLCVFLASPLAGFICGTTVLIDGGRSAVMQDF